MTTNEKWIEVVAEMRSIRLQLNYSLNQITQLETRARQLAGASVQAFGTHTGTRRTSKRKGRVVPIAGRQQRTAA